MAKVPSPESQRWSVGAGGKGGQPRKGEEGYLNFRVPRPFHKEFAIFEIQRDYRSQTDRSMLPSGS
jgi:hypothetical protein